MTTFLGGRIIRSVGNQCTMENSGGNPFLWTKRLVLNFLLPTGHPQHGPRLLSSFSLSAGKRPRQEKGHAAASITATSIVPPVKSEELGNPNKEELGRGTWTLLHSIAAKYPDKPSRQQRRDVQDLVRTLTRLYPCEQCALHFRQIVKDDPPATGSRQELEEWTCRVHNIVNRSLGKPSFNCSYVRSRWGDIDCGEEESCTVDFTSSSSPKVRN